MTASQPSPHRAATAIILALLGIGLALATHFYGVGQYLEHLNTDETLYQPQHAPQHDAMTTPEPHDELPRLTRRLWVVILDGLRDDVANSLPHIADLSTRGVRRTLHAEFPTFTYPNLTALVTGVPPVYSGVRMNLDRAGVPLDSLLASADRARTPTFIVSQWDKFSEVLDPRHAGHAAQVMLDALLSRPPEVELAFIYFGDIDEAGHRYGADSSAYWEAARRGDALLGQLADELDFSQDVLVALSDHGHRASGGHGGVEPEVRSALFLAAGSGLRSGVVLRPARMRDVCVTLAALLGLPPPRDNLGVPMLDIIARPRPELAKIFAATFTQRQRSDALLEARLGAKLGSDSYLANALRSGDPTALENGERELRDREQRREALLSAGLRTRTFVSLGAAAVACGLLGLLFLLALRRGWLRMQLRDLLPFLTYWLVFLILYFLDGQSLSWSISRGQLFFTLETALMGTLAALAAFAVGRTRRIGDRRHLEQAGALVLLWAGYLFIVAAAGADPAWLASPRISFLLIFLSTAEFYAAVMFGLLALGSLRGDAHKTHRSLPSAV